MADAPGCDATHVRLVEEFRQRSRVQVVFHALTVLVPGLDVTALPYREALDRLCAACMAEVERLDAADR